MVSRALTRWPDLPCGRRSFFRRGGWLPALAIAAALAFSRPVAGQPAEIAVPEPLEPWVPWVLAEHLDLPCPRLDSTRLCAWPGVLELDLDDDGGTFLLAVVADRELELPLPGGPEHWPRELSVDQRPALALRRGDRPTIRLDAGRQVVRGRFSWRRAPESLAVPAEVGRIELRLRGRAIPSPRREQDGRLWLEAATQLQPVRDQLDLAVSRRLDDGVPVTLTVHLDLRVSGRAREVDLGQPLPDGFAASWLDGDLPARLDEGGRMVVQLRPGRWSLRLVARSLAPVDTLGLGERPAPWPGEEVWVFRGDPNVRAVDPGGAPAVDPDRTTLPSDWRGLPAFRLRQGGALTLDTLRRGAAEPPPDTLTVDRSWWLSFDGRRFVVRDQLAGTLHQGGRLAAHEPAVLGRFSLGTDGTPTDEVITVRDGETPGVETRVTSLAATAELTYPRGGRLPAVGWNRDTSSLDATLHLPPGWSLFAAPGVDRARSTWIERWSLLDLFFLLIVSLVSGRLLGRVQGVATFALLALAWHEPHATGLWIGWLLLLAMVALGRVWQGERGRRFRRLLLAVVLMGFGVQLFVFCGTQLRSGLFPQLDRPPGDGGWVVSSGRFQAPASVASYDDTAEREEVGAAPSAPEEPRRKLLYLVSTGSDPDALPQTGPGIPSWQWSSYRLRWNGPVSEDHGFRLWLVSPTLEALLSLLRVALALVLAWRLAGPTLPSRRPESSDERAPEPGATEPRDNEPGDTEPSDTEPSDRERSAAGGAAAVVLLALLGTAGADAQEVPAATPSPALLAELEQRLTAPPPCHPECLEVSRLFVEASGETLRLRAEVNTEAATAWRLPGPSAAWSPRTVRVDGRESEALRRLGDGFLALRLDTGRHTVELVGAAVEGLDLQFHRPPRVLDWRGDGWRLDGLRPDQAPPASVQLNRVVRADATGDTPTTAAAAFTPWLELRRTVVVGLPWSVEMELERHGPADRPVRLAIPLLAGEAVLDPGLEVADDSVAVVLERGETVRRWRSQLDETPSLELTAPDDPRWLERWALACSPVFHCETEGLAPVSVLSDGRWLPRWQPWPGEQVVLRIDRPEAAAGATTTLDAVDLHVTPGRRLLEGTLHLELRSSRGGEHGLQLPAEAELQRFELDGAERPVQNVDGALRFTVEPGSHQVVVAWRQPHGLGVFERFPEVGIEGRAVNVGLSLSMPENRWLLWAGGPSWGPVVAFWQLVLAIGLAAWALGKLAPTPLRGIDWFLLGLGMTQVPLAAPVIVVIWFLVLANRGRTSASRWWSWNLQQLALLALSMVALVLLYAAVHAGLLVRPDMQVVGGGSTGHQLAWTVDATEGSLPTPWVLWLPLFVWRLLMLGWALWLASRLLRWLPWVWGQLTVGPLLVTPKGWKQLREPEAEPRD